MRMKNLGKSIILLLAAAMVLFLAGCPMGTEESGDASVTSISVAGTPVTLVPSPVSQGDWTKGNFDLSGLESSQLGQVVIAQESALTNAAIVVTASAGAQVKYAATDFEVPQTFQSGNTITLFSGGYLVIQVTSEDGKNVNYYVVEIKLANAITSLTSVTVGGITANFGTPNAAWNAVTAPGSVGLSAATKTNAAVAVTKANAKQTVKYAKAAGSAEPSFGDTASFSFEDGDFLYIEVTAENGINKGVYKLEIQVGRDTTLSALSIGGVEVSNPGTSAADLASVTTPGSVLINTLQPFAGHPVTVTPTDSEATVTWAAAASAAETPTEYGAVSSIVFTDRGYLVVKVVAANGTTTAYYKIQVNLMSTATIKYGQPEIKASSDQYIDPIWDSVVETYSISKVYPADSTADYIANPTTSGIAKALWDASGLYVYVTVTDPTVDTSSSENYTKDSVELFINEAVNSSGNLIKDPVTIAEKGGQYRVDAAGATSGDPSAAAGAINPDKVSAWTTANGYVIIFQAPWRFLDNYPLADEKKIGFELQINACSNGGRDGVMVWNNIAHTNYQNVSDYGEATLDLNGQTLAVNAKNPTISAQPVGAVYSNGETTAAALSVAAESPDGGTLSYQWYSNTTNSYTDGTPIANETGNTYTPIITSDGTTYYWVKVTNTIADNNDGGNKTATLQSSIVSIVVSSVPLVEKIEAGGSSTPVYRFTPKSGKTWSDYKEITFTVMVTDEDTYGKSARAYVAGNYAASVFGTTGENGVYSNWNAARLVKITDGTAVSTLLGDCGLSTWKTLAYPVVLEDLNNDQKDSAYVPDTYYPGSEDTGPFYFGLGLTLNQNNVSGTISYYIKDVALVESGGDKLYADNINTAFDSTTLGQLKCIFHNTSGVVIRTQEPDPSEK